MKFSHFMKVFFSTERFIRYSISLTLLPALLATFSGCYDAPNPLPTCIGWVDGNQNYPNDRVKDCCQQDRSGYYGKLKSEKRTDLMACMSCNPLFCTDLLVQERGLITNFNTSDTSDYITRLGSAATSTPGKSEAATQVFGLAGGLVNPQVAKLDPAKPSNPDSATANKGELASTEAGVLSSVKEGQTFQVDSLADIPTDPFSGMKKEIENARLSDSAKTSGSGGLGSLGSLTGSGPPGAGSLSTSSAKSAATEGEVNFQINSSFSSSGSGKSRKVASAPAGGANSKATAQGDTAVDFGSGTSGSADGEFIQINDPEDYFTRLDLTANLFKSVQKRYEKIQFTWIQAK